jgi:hypothetical protein
MTDGKGGGHDKLLEAMRILEDVDKRLYTLQRAAAICGLDKIAGSLKDLGIETIEAYDLVKAGTTDLLHERHEQVQAMTKSVVEAALAGIELGGEEE